MDVRRLQFVKAQIGAGNDQVLAGLLGPADLPAGPWRVADQRTWRTGEIGPVTAWGQRARQAGSVTAWRSFRHKTTRRWIWIQVTPTASADDADSLLAEIGERMLRNLIGRGRLVSERDVQVEPFAGARLVWAREQHTEDRAGPQIVLLLAGTVRHRVVIVCLAGRPAWDWQSASELAALQVARLEIPH